MAISNGQFGSFEVKNFCLSQVVNIGKSIKTGYFNIYPNPTTGVVQLDYFLDTPGNLSVAVLDVLGRPIQNIRMPVSRQGSRLINLQDYPVGIYFIMVEMNAVTVVKKLIIAR